MQNDNLVVRGGTVRFNYDQRTGRCENEDDPGLEIDRRARKLMMSAPRKVSYAEARDEVMKDDPELAREYLNLGIDFGGGT